MTTLPKPDSRDRESAVLPVAERLRITEIFYSLQGEARTVGLPTAFVRLTGCPLRCGYCDTEYAFSGGEWISLEDILARVVQPDGGGDGRARGAPLGGVSESRPGYARAGGGEPLAQRPCRELLRRLCDRDYEVSLETGGALEIGDIDPRVSIVMDLKTPGSGEERKNLYANIERLRPGDQVKFVICDREDYEWSRARLAEYRLDEISEVLFSPAYGQVSPTELAEWILADRLPVRLQIQLHKLLWGEARGR